MSFKPFSSPLALKNKSSLQKKLLVIGPHFVVFLILLGIDVFPLLIKLFLLMLVIFSAHYFSQLHLQKKLSRSVLEIYQDSAKNWFIKTLNHDYKAVSKLPSSFVSNTLIIINYIDADKNNYTSIFTPDSLSSDDYRRLIVRLKMT